MLWNRSRTIAVGGIVAGLVLAGGGGAIAATQGSAAKTRPQDAWLKIASRVEHGQFVTKGKNGPVTRDVVNGTVASVSPTAITVRAADNTSQTYAVTSKTIVRVRTAGKGAKGTIGSVTAGDHVIVLGTGTTQFTANRVVDIHR